MSLFHDDAIRGAVQRCEVAALRGLAGVLRWLGPVRASDAGGWVARLVGPRLPASRVADANLVRALPALGAAERAAVIRAVWDNLGRNAAELPHLARLGRTEAGPGWELEGEAHVEALRAAGVQAVFFSGHFGNWEMVLPIAARLGVPVAGFYRAASNAAVDGFVQALRQDALGPGVAMFAKGRQGARAALAHLRGGGSLGLLVDQKMNDGIAVPFLGRDAMTATGMAEMALRFGAAVVPVRVVRLGPARFRLVCEAPLVVARTGERAADVRALTVAMNAVLEGWVRADPGAWLWLHRRWPKEG
ncbi:MAG: lysophospholipid acyltransferase family protein [Janthinobacterium lividum]